MQQSDHELGMDQNITRRDFLHDGVVAALATLGLGLPQAGIAATHASPVAASAGIDATVEQAYYPPTRTGLRGSHPGAFEAAHALAREGKSFGTPQDLPEEYDLIVVGAGISGLAAAQYYRKRFGRDSRILMLENHDDFGGHAKRNEFHQGGEMRLSLGGTQNLEHWQFSDVVKSMMQELGIDVKTMLPKQEFAYGATGRNGPAIWFDARTYGSSKLVTNFSLTGEYPAQSLDSIDEFPLRQEAREQLKRFYSMRKNVLENVSEKQVETYLAKTRYVDFLAEHGGLGKQAIQLFDKTCHGSWGVESRNMSASEALESGLPGLHLLGYETTSEDWDYPVAMFPDGNASVARLQVHALIPAVAPGTTAANVALAKFDYSELDNPTHSVRLRLNSTAVNAVNIPEGVAVTYINQHGMHRVKARHCVMACYHSIIPHLCPDMSAEQKAAQKYQVKRPLILTNVLLRSSDAMDRLGISGAHCPGSMHAEMFLFKGLNTGGYSHPLADTGPVPLTLWGSISPPLEVEDLKAQLRASREMMLALTFEDYEREVRTVLNELLGPAGFDVKNDILAMTVNRWPHGYSHDYMDLWDPDWPEDQAPHEIARRRHGNITIANADAGADGYTHVAIDQAFRAVQEFD